MKLCEQILRKLVLLLAALAGLGLLMMMLVTCADIVLRAFRISFSGAYDIVKMIAAVTISCALPYTTAIKGHVAVEFGCRSDHRVANGPNRIGPKC